MSKRRRRASGRLDPSLIFAFLLALRQRFASAQPFSELASNDGPFPPSTAGGGGAKRRLLDGLHLQCRGYAQDIERRFPKTLRHSASTLGGRPRPRCCSAWRRKKRRTAGTSTQVSVSSRSSKRFIAKTFCRKPIPPGTRKCWEARCPRIAVGAAIHQCFRAGVQHQGGQKARRAETLGRSARARMERHAGRGSEGRRMVLHFAQELGRGKRRRALPGDRGAQRLVGAQRQIPFSPTWSSRARCRSRSPSTAT